MTRYIDPHTDVVKRTPRELACKLTDADFMRISETRVNKEAELDELVEDLAREKKKRQDQIDELEDEIDLMRHELHRREQTRTVKCHEVFHRADDGVGYIVVIRLDTLAEVERRPASAHETQRYLPSVDGGNILDDARRAQQQERSAQPVEEGSDVPSDDVPTDDAAVIEADAPEAPEADEANAKSAKPKPEKFDPALLEQGKCGLRFEGRDGCELEPGHAGLHKSYTHSWKARRPKVEQAEASE